MNLEHYTAFPDMEPSEERNSQFSLVSQMCPSLGPGGVQNVAIGPQTSYSCEAMLSKKKQLHYHHTIKGMILQGDCSVITSTEGWPEADGLGKVIHVP